MTTTTIEIDEELAAAVRRSGWIRNTFYVVVLLVALAGQVSGAVEALHIQLVWAIPAVGALELGGMVVLNNADVRRRLGEQAVGSRLLSVGIAAFAVAFNWLGHANHLQGAFYAGMSALGYLVWLMSTENKRRDRLRAKGHLPPTAPAYGLWRWARHPARTARARTLALAKGLDLYASLAAVQAAELAEREQARQRRRQAAIAEVLHRKIAASVDKTTAQIAVTVYDLDEIARRLADSADYDGLTGLIAADLDPGRLLLVGDADTDATGPAGVPLSAHVPAVVLAQVRRTLADMSTDNTADTAVDKLPASGTDTDVDIPADTPAPRARTSGQDPQPRRAARRGTGKGPADIGAAIRRLRERHPGMSYVDIAKQLQISTKTVTRHLNGSGSAAQPDAA